MVTKRIRHYQNNFTKGEIDRSLWGHGNLDGYYEGLASAENVWVTGSGSVAKRYGLIAVRRYEGMRGVRMYPFTSVSGHQCVVLVVVGRIDVLVSGSGELVASVDAGVISEDIIGDLRGVPYQDSVIFTHNDMPPQILKYGGGNNFTLSEIIFTNIPSFEFIGNDVHPAGSMTPSGISGFIGVISSAGAFLPTDVGKYISVLPVGRLRIMKVNSGTAVTGYLEENLFDQGAVASGDWAIERGWEPLWGGDSGYPGVAGFHGGRLILGNFVHARSVFAYSVVNSPFDYSMGDGTAAYGGWRILSHDQGEAVHHIVSEHGLYFFCGGGEYVVDQGSGDTLGRAVIRHDSERGVVPRVPPVTTEDGSIYFFQPNSVALSEFRYYDDRGSYEATAISRYGRHLLNMPCSAALWKGDRIFNTNVLFYVNSDGTMVACTLNKVEKIIAFSRVVSRWEFTGVCVANGIVYVSAEEGDDTIVLRFLSGHYLDDGMAYRSHVTTLPISNDTSSYSGLDITVTGVYVYISASESLEIGGEAVYRGAPVTGKFTRWYPSGWTSDGMVTVSDGGVSARWQVNNIGRTALVGGVQ